MPMRGGKDAKEAVKTDHVAPSEPVVEDASAPEVTETGPVGEADATAVESQVSALANQIRELEGRVAALVAERDSWAEKAQVAHDQFLRARSDLDGFRKRTERDLEDRITRGKADFILSLLEVLDNFDRAIDAAQRSGAAGLSGTSREGSAKSGDGMAAPSSGPADSAVQAFAKGVDMIRRQFVDALQREGVEAIPSPVGGPMDPNLHDAVAALEGGGEHGTVTDELRKGYLYKGMVLRPTRVRVIR
jgi:molecular chaperone GrpE